MATTAAALFASRSIQSLVVIGWPVSGWTPNPDQWPSPLMFSLPIEPSMISTNGSSLPASASYQAWMYSWPTSYATTWLWMTTRGIPGMTPVMMSSRLGLVAAVIATESPSHESPVVIHSTWAVIPSVCCWFGTNSTVANSPSLSVPRGQQILGSGSPTSWSMTRLPPNAVSTNTIPGGSVLTSPISTARSHPGTARSAASAASHRSGATKATSLPSFATYIGSILSSSAAPATAGSI